MNLRVSFRWFVLVMTSIELVACVVLSWVLTQKAAEKVNPLLISFIVVVGLIPQQWI